MVYPWAHIRDVIGHRWARQALSTQWLQFDNAFKELQAGLLSQREAGCNVRDLDRPQVFIEAVNSAADDKQPFARAVLNQCLTFDEEEISVTGNQWESYVSALKQYIENSNFDPGLEDSANNISDRIQSLDSDVDPSQYTSVFHELERQLFKAQRAAEERAGIVGYTLFRSETLDLTKNKDAHRLETYLRDRIHGCFIHPVSVR